MSTGRRTGAQRPSPVLKVAASTAGLTKQWHKDRHLIQVIHEPAPETLTPASQDWARGHWPVKPPQLGDSRSPWWPVASGHSIIQPASCRGLSVPGAICIKEDQ
jgi:hypothetical protein